MSIDLTAFISKLPKSNDVDFESIKEFINETVREYQRPILDLESLEFHIYNSLNTYYDKYYLSKESSNYQANHVFLKSNGNNFKINVIKNKSYINEELEDDFI